MVIVQDIFCSNVKLLKLSNISNMWRKYVVPSAGSVDNKLAICAAEASKPSQSSGASSDSSPTSNPD